MPASLNNLKERDVSYSDGGGKFWQVDLTSRVGARSATYTGSLGAFVMCAMAVFGAVLFGGLAGISTPEGMAAVIGAALEATIALVAGLRFRAGKGVIAGSIAAAFMALEAVAKLVTLSLGAIISVVILVVIVNGVRGALALRKGAGFEDDDLAVFE